MTAPTDVHWRLGCWRFPSYTVDLSAVGPAERPRICVGCSRVIQVGEPCAPGVSSGGRLRYVRCVTTDGPD